MRATLWPAEVFFHIFSGLVSSARASLRLVAAKYQARFDHAEGAEFVEREIAEALEGLALEGLPPRARDALERVGKLLEAPAETEPD